MKLGKNFWSMQVLLTPDKWALQLGHPGLEI
jgi:hypothetical protein